MSRHTMVIPNMAEITCGKNLFPNKYHNTSIASVAECSWNLSPSNLPEAVLQVVQWALDHHHDPSGPRPRISLVSSGFMENLAMIPSFVPYPSGSGRSMKRPLSQQKHVDDHTPALHFRTFSSNLSNVLPRTCQRKFFLLGNMKECFIDRIYECNKDISCFIFPSGTGGFRVSSTLSFLKASFHIWNTMGHHISQNIENLSVNYCQFDNMVNSNLVSINNYPYLWAAARLPRTRFFN